MTRMKFGNMYPAEGRHKTLLEQPGMEKSNLIRLMANLEDTLHEYVQLSMALRYRGTLDPLLREIAILRVCHVMECQYDLVYHQEMINILGFDAGRVKQIYSWPDAPDLDDLQKAVIRFADEAIKQYRPSDEAFGAVESRLSRRDLHELTMNIGYYAMSNIHFRTFDLELESDAIEMARTAYETMAKEYRSIAEE